MAAHTTLADVAETPQDPAVILEHHGTALAMLLFAVTAVVGVMLLLFTLLGALLGD